MDVDDFGKVTKTTDTGCGSRNGSERLWLWGGPRWSGVTCDGLVRQGTGVDQFLAFALVRVSVVVQRQPELLGI